MSRLRRALGVGVGVGVLGAVVLAGPAGAQTVTLSPPTAAVGSSVQVLLAGWRPGPVQVELCGGNASRGSVDCDVVGATAVVADAAGAATASLVLGPPPTSCPCVVRVAAGTDMVRLAPIGVDGLAAAGGAPATTPIAAVQASPFRIERLRVTGGTGVTGWFGAAPGRTAEVTIENTGTAAAVPPLELEWRKGGGTPRVIAVGELEALNPGQSRTYRVGFHLPTMAVGSYTVTGSLAGADVAASTSTTPWGLVLVGALAAYLVLFKVVVATAVRVRGRGRGGPAPVRVEPSVAPLVWPTVDPPVGGDALVARWDLVGAATPELVLAALLDAGASEDAVRTQLASLPVSGLRFQVARSDEGGTSVIVELAGADALRELGSVGSLLGAGRFTDGTLALARRALGFLADASPTTGIPADPATILATIGACAAVDDLGVGAAVCAPVDLGVGRSLSPDAVGVEVLRRHGIPWVASLSSGAPVAPAALAIVAATLSPSGAVGPAVVAAVGTGHPSMDRAAEPGSVRVVVGRVVPVSSVGTDAPASLVDRRAL